MSFKIGCFTSGEDIKSFELFNNTYQAIKDLHLDVNISYLFSTFKKGERRENDQGMASIERLGIKVITSSYEEFKRSQKSKSADQLKEGSPPGWQEEYDQQLMDKISDYPIDAALFIEYTPPIPISLIKKYNTLQLRAAPPNGPAGDRSTIIWQLIGTRAAESGATLHLLTENEPDLGLVLTYCHYPIKSRDFIPLWRDFDRKMKTYSMRQIMETEDGNNALYKAIREAGGKWFQPLLTLTIKYLSTREISIKDHSVYVNDKLKSEEINLTEDIERNFFKKKVEESNIYGASEEEEDTAWGEEEEEKA